MNVSLNKILEVMYFRNFQLFRIGQGFLLVFVSRWETNDSKIRF